MPFDPDLPRSGTKMRSGEVRDNFIALKSLIDAVPAGQQGPPGLKGEPGEQGLAGADGQPGANGADSTVPGPAGADGRSVVEVYDSGDGRAMIRMSDGTIYGPFIVASGPAGQQGSNGADSTVPGPAGPEGRHVTNVRDNGDGRAIIDMSDGGSYGPFVVAGGPPGSQGERGSDGGQGPAGNDGRSIVNVRDSGDGRAIVDMSDGGSYGPFTVAGGPAGPPGNDGATGPQGIPGEVTSQQLSDAIGGTSANTNGVQLLGLTVSDPPTQSEMQAIANKLDELINAQRR